MAILETDILAIEICRKLGLEIDRMVEVVIRFKAGHFATIDVQRIIMTEDKIEEAKWENYMILPKE